MFWEMIESSEVRGSITSRSGSINKSMYARRRTSESSSPGVKKSIQGLRLSVSVKRTRKEYGPFSQGSLYGVVIELN